jgi:ribosomal protein S27AE
MRPHLCGHTMSRLLPEFEKAKEEPVSRIQEQDLSIEQEIECPRCHDVMTLHSEFDRLGYYCEECSFSLHLSR